MARKAKDLDLVLHIGLHKTASSYVQNILSARRYDLIQHGVLYPSTGISDYSTIRTRDGAQSGHLRFAGRRVGKGLMAELLEEVPPTASTVLLSAENFSDAHIEPEAHLDPFGGFRSVAVVLVLRRQDVWIESFYKQVVDQYYSCETRSFDEYLAQEGMGLLDFHTRFSPWRELVGPENFHVISYDDVPDGLAICRRILDIVGVDADSLDPFPGVEAPRYHSMRAIDTIGLRVLNSCRLKTRDIRDQAAREIYAAAPAGDIELLTPEMRAAIQERCAPINALIEAEWLAEPVPGLRFGSDTTGRSVTPPSASELVAYLDRAIDLANSAWAADVALIAETEAALSTDADAEPSATALPTDAPVAPSATAGNVGAR